MNVWQLTWYGVFILVLAVVMYAPAEARDSHTRIKRSLNEGWMFQFESSYDSARRVHLPHTWNAEDPFDEQRGYHRGVGIYQRALNLTPKPDRVYKLQFEAVNQIAEISVNGQQVGSHIGGYTGFVVDITSYLQEGNNTITVRVDNRHSPDVPPLKGDFNFYGGIYRDVWLLELPPIHFGFDEYGASQVFVRTPDVSQSAAQVNVAGTIKNISSTGDSYRVVHQLMDRQGNIVTEQVDELMVKLGSTAIDTELPIVQNPHLWHPDNPYLYTLVSEIRSGDQLIDRVTNPVGLRWFRFDADSGFYLNGKQLKLMGVNRHQDYQGRGNALSNARHVADVELAKATGANFLRTAHYPQDPAVLEACDRLGLLVSMEIPLDHEITDSEAFYSNTVRMQREMIRQNFNHPSVIIWAYMNEMLLGRNWEEDKQQISKITRFAKELEAVTREEDPSRYTMIPNHGKFDLYEKAGLTDIPMIVGWNLYFGWYEEELKGLGDFMDHFHEAMPEKPTIITEYGAGSDPRIRSLEPVRFDFSMEWQNTFLWTNLHEIMKRPYIAGAAVWNLFDFGSESRRDAVPAINSKGLMTFDRKPKDSYYLLQSWLRDDPVLAIGSAGWDKRAGMASKNNPDVAIQEVDVYGNTGRAELFINEKSLGKKSFQQQVAQWDVPFRNGENKLKVIASSDSETIRDEATIDFTLHQTFDRTSAKQFKDIYINSGANFFFRDETNGIIWQPDTAYRTGFWGFEGGESFMPRNVGIGTNADILGTQRDPLFQTQRVSPKQYRFDVPKGRYEILLLFSALQEGPNQFQISINGKMIFDDIALGGRYRAVTKKAEVYTDQPQLEISFTPVQGSPVINGIGIRQIN